MAVDEKGGRMPENPKLRLHGLAPDEEPGPMQVLAFARDGECLAAVEVGDDGSFELDEGVIEEAHRIKIGPAGKAAEKAPDSVYLTYRATDFASILESGVLDVAPGIWKPWFPFTRCASGSVKRCYPSPWWYEDLVLLSGTPQKRTAASRTGISATRGSAGAAEIGVTRISPAIDLGDLILWPPCSTICLGTVEVYRRVCCCEPWVVEDPRIPGLVEELRDIVRGIPEIPDFPPVPPPGPDPAPIREAFFTGGALDRKALHARQDLHALQTLPAAQVADYVNGRPYLFCRSYSCDEPVKVAEGRIGPDGRFNICWDYFPVVLESGCHEEIAYKVKQEIGPFTFTVYDGPAAGEWFDADDEPELTSYHPLAVACRDNGGEGDAFVYLDVIGDTGSENLGTPDQDGAESVQTPAWNSGVAFPTSSPTGPGGASGDRNWGGTLKLSIMFSESMRGIGAKYYRVSIAPADGAGDPSGTREYVKAGLSWTKAVATGTGVDIVPVSLGPKSEGGRNHLYEIPFDGALGSNEDWEDQQYHVHLDTTDPRWGSPGRYLVTIEVFDDTGQRLRPNGTPATGIDSDEVEAAFTFRRKFQETGPTNMVPYGALTHMFWWDNRAVVAHIADLRMNGLESDEECQFLAGTPSSTFGIGYHAYHLEELFQRHHTITWKRGLSGGTGTLLAATHDNVGVPLGTAPPHPSPTDTFANMLGGHTRCAFTVFLTTGNKKTDGDDLGYSAAHDSASFALELT